MKRGLAKASMGDLVLEIQPSYKVVHEKSNDTEKLTRSNMISCPVIFFGNNIKAEKIKTTIKCSSFNVYRYISYIYYTPTPLIVRNLTR